MKKSYFCCFLFAALTLFVTFAAFTATAACKDEAKSSNRDAFYATPLQLSFFAPLQLAPEDSDVYGLKLSLPYGVNKELCGLAVGICSSDDNLYGLNIGLCPIVKGEQYGIQLGGLFTSSGSDSGDIAYGLNIAGGVNIAASAKYGASIAGLVDFSVNSITGLQLACWNRAEKVIGLQIGIVNYADELTGVQLGLVNICPSGYIPFMLIVNAKF